MSSQVAKTYLPGEITYNYISDIQSISIPYNDDSPEVATLESHGYDRSYPSQYCNNVVYGAYEMEINSILNMKITGVGGIWQTVKGYQDAKIDLAVPIITAYNQATKIFKWSEFGQSVGEDVPANVNIVSVENGTEIRWYDNGTLVCTDTLTNSVEFFALAVGISGNTIQQYAYIYMVGDKIWTSGAKSNASVLSILNDGGSAGGEDLTKNGWSDEDLGDFVISRIFRYDGADGNSGEIASNKNTLAEADEFLQEVADNYGGWLGTDIISYMTGKSNGEGWTYLLSAAGDNCEMVIPSTDGHTYKLVFKHAYDIGIVLANQFVLYKDDTALTNFTTSQKTNGSYIFLTWYRQTLDFEDHTRLLLVYMASDYTYRFYNWSSYLANTDFQEFDYELQFWDLIDGYDPASGQDDDPQDDPEDVEDPEYDPLASGFLYAFMVTKTDMEHLMEALTPETFAELVRVDFGNNLYDFIVSYHMMPCLTNADSINKTAIAYRGNAFKYGANNDTLMLAPITKSWYKVDCGVRVCQPKNVRFDGFENWSSAQVQLYLPFIGYVHLNTSDVWGKEIHIVYTFDILQGTCSANVGVGANGTIYTFNGSCIYKIPFTSVIDKSNQEILAGITSSLGTAVSIGSVAGGNIGGVVSAAGSGADAVGHFVSAFEHKSVINRGGNLSGSPGWNAPRSPCLIITIPDIVGNKTSDPMKPSRVYNSINGYPTYIEDTLSNYTDNYVEVGQIDLKPQPNLLGAVPNDAELEMIRSLVKDGVYV